MTDQHNTDRNWMYYKLYLGQYTNRADQVLIELARRIETGRRFSQWFFLRYLDDSGLHLRVRLLAAPGSQAGAQEAAEATIAAVLDAMPGYAATEHLAMVTPPGMDQREMGATLSKGGVRFVPDTYQPEYDKYGGPAGMPIAEEVFMASSQVAVKVMADEAAGHYSRKGLVPHLMRACLEALRPGTAEQFWGRYCMFWLGGESPAASDWRQRFLAKGEDLRRNGVEVCPPDAELDPRALVHLNRWRSALAHAAVDYRERAEETGAAFDVLCFNFAHLMNNRLGLTALEEAYMATLLQQCEMSEVAA